MTSKLIIPADLLYTNEAITPAANEYYEECIITNSSSGEFKDIATA